MEINALLASRSMAPQQNSLTDTFFIGANDIISLVNFIKSVQPQRQSQKVALKIFLSEWFF